MKTTKTIFFAITVVLLSLLTTSCIPTTPGGNPTPGNQFDINISDENTTSTGTTPGGDIISKKILVDDDSIEFSLKRSSAIMCGNCMETVKIVFKNTTTNYESLVLNNTDSTYNITTVAAGVTIPNGLDSTYHWVILNSNVYTRNASTIVLTPKFSDLSNYGTDDRYLIFRKLKGANYQYYWIKLKYPNYYFLHVLNGKYQLNSITTGL